MNQNPKIFNEVRTLKCVASSKRASKLIFVAPVLVACSLLLHEPVLGQNQFEPQSSQTDFGTWTPPNSMPSVYQNPGSAQNSNSQFSAIPQPTLNENGFAPQDSGLSFPESVTPFDTGIRTANYQVPNADVSTDSESFDGQIDSAAATLSKWKDIAGEKTTGWLEEVKQEGGWLAKIQSLFGSSDISKMLGSLALVLGIYFAFVWLMRKFAPNGRGGLPEEVIEVMGQVPFGARRNLQLVRLGSKMLLLMNSAEGTQPIGEITDPSEVEYLASLCPSKGRRKTRSTPVLRNATQSQVTAPNLSSNANVPTNPPGKIGATNLNDVIRILQQATKPGGTVFEA